MKEAHHSLNPRERMLSPDEQAPQALSITPWPLGQKHPLALALFY